MKYKIAVQPDVTQVYFSGNIDEHIGPVLAEVRSQVKSPRVVFDFEFLSQVNSIGVATWLAHIKAFDDVQLTYENCPSTFSNLWQMIPGLGGKGVLESLYAGYCCQKCDDGKYHKTLVRRADCVKLENWPPHPCPLCTSPMFPEESDRELLLIFLPE